MEKFNFGDNLRMMRMYRNICQDGMAADLKISQSSYSRIEASPNVPELTMINQMAETLKFRPKDLLSTDWFAAELGGPKKQKRTVMTINRTGHISFIILLLDAWWNISMGVADGWQKDKILTRTAIATVVAFGLFFLHFFTVKEEEI